MGSGANVWSASLLGAAFLAAGASAGVSQAAQSPVHNVVIFVADGLRYGAVDASSAPQMQAIRSEGVDFANSHALFPTLTTPNASAIATGMVWETRAISPTSSMPASRPWRRPSCR